MTKSLHAPRVHSNGDSKANLLEPIAAAANTIRTAYDAVRETMPNARNYYVISPATFGLAREEHRSRLRRLDQIHDELLGLYQAIADGRLEFEVNTMETEG